MKKKRKKKKNGEEEKKGRRSRAYVMLFTRMEEYGRRKNSEACTLPK